MSQPDTRARLHALIAEACELEHALGCSYLYATFSLKRELSEGLDWRQQQIARRWASQVYHIAAQEMLHLASAWNLLLATGGGPCLERPSFPQGSRVYPLGVPIVLRRWDARTLERFVYYENPGHETGDTQTLPREELWPIEEAYDYDSVGALYGEIKRLIETIPENELFVGAPRQVGRDLIDFPEAVAITDRRSALRAIEIITEQGEGTCHDREDSHFGVFRALSEEFVALGGAALVRPVCDNPYTRVRRDHWSGQEAAKRPGNIEVTRVTNEVAVHAMDLFDDVYVAMLQALEYVFVHGHAAGQTGMTIAQISLELMTTVIKPLGEAICQMPSGHDGLNAGPAFVSGRRAPLLPEADVARRVLTERLRDLSARARLLAEAQGDEHAVARGQCHSVATNLARMADDLAR